MKDRIINTKSLKLLLIVGSIVELISYVCYCFGLPIFKHCFWVGTGMFGLGLILLIDYFSSEGKTWFKRLDKKMDKNLTWKSSEFIFLVSLGGISLFCIPFIVELWIKGFSTKLPVLSFILIVSIILLILISVVIKRTTKEVEEIIAVMDKSARKK